MADQPLRTTRTESLGVVCPTCGAELGEECDNAEGASHAARHEAAIAAGARVLDRREMWATSHYRRRAKRAAE